MIQHLQEQEDDYGCKPVNYYATEAYREYVAAHYTIENQSVL